MGMSHDSPATGSHTPWMMSSIESLKVVIISSLYHIVHIWIYIISGLSGVFTYSHLTFKAVTLSLFLPPHHLNLNTPFTSMHAFVDLHVSCPCGAQVQCPSQVTG